MYEWRQFLKKSLLEERKYKSDLSGKYLKGCHMHEGIISRAVVPKSIKWQYLIFHPYNCFLLLPEEHIPNPPSREWSIEKSFEYYGEESVKNWFYGLPWKVIPFRI